MSKTLSFPKNKINILLLEDVHPIAFDKFESDGFHVTKHKGAMSEDELLDIIENIHILGIRSKTMVTKAVIEKGRKLMAIGAFCIGTNQIDIASCSLHGIAVFNAPYSNTRSVVELALGQMIMLMRGVFEKNAQMHQGKWNKSAKNSFELRNKVLGIIGYGRIGSQLSVLAESIGMQVVFYDVEDKMPLGNAQQLGTLKDVMERADVVSLHVDGRQENTHLIHSENISWMKEGAILLNLSRGHIVDLVALRQAIETKKLSGASVDVFPVEPKSNDEPFESDLLAYPNICLTPHIGGSTLEAQEAIADFVPNKLIQYINTGNTYGSVNLPEVQLPIQKNNHRILHIHLNKSGMLAKINKLISDHQVNINGQYLKTNEHIGYVIMDIETNYPALFIDELKSMDNTLKCRLLY